MTVADKITYTSTPEQIEAMHGAFDEALEGVRSVLGGTSPLLIDGEPVARAEALADGDVSGERSRAEVDRRPVASRVDGRLDRFAWLDDDRRRGHA